MRDLNYLLISPGRLSVTPNVIEPFRDLSHDEDRLVAMLPTEGPIAFGGTGSQYCRIARHYRCFGSERFVQVDANKYYQKLTRLNRTIHDPRIIAERKIETVVITSSPGKELDSERHPCRLSRREICVFPQARRGCRKVRPGISIYRDRMTASRLSQ